MNALAPPRSRPFRLDHPHGHRTLSGFAARITASDLPKPYRLEVLVATGDRQALAPQYAGDLRPQDP